MYNIYVDMLRMHAHTPQSILCQEVCSSHCKHLMELPPSCRAAQLLRAERAQDTQCYICGRAVGPFGSTWTGRNVMTPAFRWMRWNRAGLIWRRPPFDIYGIGARALPITYRIFHCECIMVMGWDETFVVLQCPDGAVAAPAA